MFVERDMTVYVKALLAAQTVLAFAGTIIWFFIALALSSFIASELNKFSNSHNIRSVHKEFNIATVVFVSVFGFLLLMMDFVYTGYVARLLDFLSL